jgi:hypothetical protein
MRGGHGSRRDFIRTTAYVAPAILTLKAAPSFAQTGSGRLTPAETTPKDPKPKGNNGVGNGVDPQPPGNPPVNDGPGTGPGNPGNRGGGHGRGGL